jgi:hypothetical protein
MTVRRGTVSILSALAMMLGLFAVGQGQAQALVLSTSTSFGFFSSPDAFLGQVRSNNNRCRAGRVVLVYQERGRRDRLIGRDRATSTGLWTIERDVPRARYYALVPRKRFGFRGRHICRRYKSSTLLFG